MNYLKFLTIPAFLLAGALWMVPSVAVAQADLDVNGRTVREPFPAESWSTDTDLLAALGRQMSAETPPFDPLDNLVPLRRVPEPQESVDSEHMLTRIMARMLELAVSAQVTPETNPTRESPEDPVLPESLLPQTEALPVEVSADELDANVMVCFREDFSGPGAEYFNIRLGDAGVLTSNSARQGTVRWVAARLERGEHVFQATRYSWEETERQWQPLERIAQPQRMQFSVADPSRVLVIEITIAEGLGAAGEYRLRSYFLQRDNLDFFPGIRNRMTP